MRLGTSIDAIAMNASPEEGSAAALLAGSDGEAAPRASGKRVPQKLSLAACDPERLLALQPNTHFNRLILI